MRSSNAGLFSASGAASTSLNRCPRAAMPANSPVRYSFCAVSNGPPLVIAWSMVIVGRRSVNIALISFLRLELSDVSLCVVGRPPTGLLHDGVQGRVDVLRHAR